MSETTLIEKIRAMTGYCSCTWVRNHKGVEPQRVIKDPQCPVHGSYSIAPATPTRTEKGEE